MVRKQPTLIGLLLFTLNIKCTSPGQNFHQRE
uniref:Uncharacterized protein n=1 Tax=Anopheles funestus TaxID=62324 RepID=A0A182S1T8_ANOFN